MTEKERTTYRISEVARLLGISAEWLRAGERRGFFPPARRDRNGHRYFTREDVERLRSRRGQPDAGGNGDGKASVGEQPEPEVGERGPA